MWRIKDARLQNEPLTENEKNMKNLNRILFTAVAAASLTLVSSAFAQYATVGDDGVAASPKLRQALKDSSVRVAPAHASAAVVGTCCENNIVASPKVRQTLSAEAKCCAAPSKDNLVSTTAKPNDGIFASPKVRAQLNERPQQFQIAPIK